MNKKILLIVSLFFLFLFMPITANAKTYFISLDNGYPLVDENDIRVSTKSLTKGDIIYDAPNKYEVINVEDRTDIDNRYVVNCKCLLHKSKSDIYATYYDAYIYDGRRFNGFDLLEVKEFDRNAFNGYKKVKNCLITIDEIPSWFNKKLKNVSKLSIYSSLVKKNTFANCKKLSHVELSSCTLEENAFANCIKLSTVDIFYGVTLGKNSFKNVSSTVYYHNGTSYYDKVKGTIYKTEKSIPQIKKEIKRAGFKKGTIVKVMKLKPSNSEKVYKTIKI